MKFSRFFALSFSLCLRFVMRVSIGVLIGWGLDRHFHTFPALLIVFTFLGGYFGFKALVSIRNSVNLDD